MGSSEGVGPGATSTEARRDGRAGRARGRPADDTAQVVQQSRNEVLLTGRVAAAAVERTLPSGDVIATLRVVVTREPSARRRADGAPAATRTTVDTIDVVTWTAASRRAAMRLTAGETVEVEGALRRRFFGVPGGRASRYEVEARRLRRASGRRVTDT